MRLTERPRLTDLLGRVGVLGGDACTYGCESGVIGDACITCGEAGSMAVGAATCSRESSSSDSSTGMDPGSIAVLRTGTDAALLTDFFKLDLRVLDGDGVSVSPFPLPLDGAAAEGKLVE